MSFTDPPNPRPDIVAATRGGDSSLGMDGEAELSGASLETALYWQNIYREILAMEEQVVERIHELMKLQSPEARQEVELTNPPVVVSQAKRFSDRLGYWDTRVNQLRSS